MQLPTFDLCVVHGPQYGVAEVTGTFLGVGTHSKDYSILGLG